MAKRHGASLPIRDARGADPLVPAARRRAASPVFASRKRFRPSSAYSGDTIHLGTEVGLRVPAAPPEDGLRNTLRPLSLVTVPLS
jgi:hypothetical protein